MRQRRLLQKQVLVHIIREDPSEHYQNLLKETEGWIRHKNETATGFPCCFAGCNFVGKRHIYYVKHLKKTHFLNSKFRCNYGKACKQMFTSVEQLESHVVDIHLKKQEPTDVFIYVFIFKLCMIFSIPHHPIME